MEALDTFNAKAQAEFKDRVQAMRRYGLNHEADEYESTVERMVFLHERGLILLDDISGVHHCLREGYLIGIPASLGRGTDAPYAHGKPMDLYAAMPFHLPADCGAWYLKKPVSWTTLKSAWARLIAQPEDNYGFRDCFENGECPQSWDELFNAAAMINAEYGI